MEVNAALLIYKQGNWGKAQLLTDLGFRLLWSDSWALAPHHWAARTEHWLHALGSKQCLSVLFRFDLGIGGVSFSHVLIFLGCSKGTLTVWDIMDYHSQQIELNNLVSTDNVTATVLQHWTITTFFFFLWPHPQHMEVSRPGIEPELQLQPMLQLQQHWIL